MAGVIPTSRELAQPVVEALKRAFLLDDLGIHVERRNQVDDVAVWYEVSILSHEEFVLLGRIAETTHAKVAVIPDDKSRMKVELRVSGRLRGARQA